MRKIIQLLAFVVVSNLSYGQTLDALQRKGDSLYRAKDYRKAAITFSSGAKLGASDRPGIIFRNRLNASRCWALANCADSAFVQLNQISTIKNLGYNDLIALTTDQDLVSLRRDPRWAAITKKLFDSITKESFFPLDATYTQEEIIYGRKYGMALTMLRLKPKAKGNGKSIILIRSGGWGSTFYIDFPLKRLTQN